ncbi:hypothetical protein ASG73_00935 [Janibacter sp. Soil728]|uniref:aromatic-ring-hydroxylating dioxygenase subunit beta n=1 Tax=Janibacter sp. Soil728 TaxID=1736393 RepID=UPI0006F7EBCD|nr:aromatic-ring-hydroxylating dioxygenase subunit beta [Janibacter sp. Soil728]KRE38964.1 hypothetical protein ASG73_00935 [Janibacter sp. Soil728]
MTTTETAWVTSTDLQHEIQQFLFREASLLDSRSFPEWLHLFTADCTYWIPSGTEEDPSRKVSIVYDSFSTLTERVWRFEGGLAFAQQPASVSSHLVSNVVVEEVVPGGHPDGDLIRVRSRFVVTEFRYRDQYVYAGSYEHQLVRTAEGLRIHVKRVDLVSRNGYLGNLGLPL